MGAGVRRAGLSLIIAASALSAPATAGPPAGDGAPPILLDPSGARRHARDLAARGDVLRAAETLLLTHDAESALDVIGPFAPRNAEELARKTRIELDAYVLLGHRRLAEQRAEELERYAGWLTHASRQRTRAELGTVQDHAGTVGAITYSIAIAFLLLAAARELLRFSRDTFVFAGALIAAVLLARMVSPVAASAIGIAGAAMLSLVHAAAAATRRIMPGPRGRLLIVALMILGMCGSAAAVLARLRLESIIAALS